MESLAQVAAVVVISVSLVGAGVGFSIGYAIRRTLRLGWWVVAAAACVGAVGGFLCVPLLARVMG